MCNEFTQTNFYSTKIYFLTWTIFIAGLSKYKALNFGLQMPSKYIVVRVQICYENSAKENLKLLLFIAGRNMIY
jgi:hypothetical protein